MLTAQVFQELPQAMLRHYCATWEWVLNGPAELGRRAWMSMACSWSREKLLMGVQECVKRVQHVVD